ncbi:MAG TPA: hydrogenase maturation protease [bacterium]|nr:hydrogenase maturation protease [bacterium]
MISSWSASISRLPVPESAGGPPADLRVRVVGVGNRFRGDDGAGLAAAQRLGEAANVPVTLLDAIGDGTALLEVWREVDTVIVLDAMRSGAAPGTVRRLGGAGGTPAAVAAALGAGRRTGSTHGLGVAEAIALGEALGRLPRRLVVIAIEGARFDTGGILSPEVERALDRAVGLGLEEVAHVHRAAR